MTGLEVSPRHLFEDREVESLVGDQLLELLVLALQFFQALGFLRLHVAVFATPAVIGVFAGAEVFTHGGNRLTASDESVGVPQLMICSGVCLLAFIRRVLLPGQGQLDSHYTWLNVRGAGQRRRPPISKPESRSRES